jgi:chromosomal replication initiation ATPase DnaA
MNLQAEIRQLRKRVATLEAAHTLREMMGATSDEAALAEACSTLRVGITSIQGTSRTPEVARARALLARQFHQRLGWTFDRIARAMHKTERGVQKMVLSSG